MTNTIKRRLEKVEATLDRTSSGSKKFGLEASETKGDIEFQMGYCQKLPSDYVGERHMVTVSRLPDGKYEWEERPGPAPADGEDDCKIIIRLTFVKGRDGVEVPYRLGDAWRELETAGTQPEIVN